MRSLLGFAPVLLSLFLSPAAAAPALVTPAKRPWPADLAAKALAGPWVLYDEGKVKQALNIGAGKVAIYDGKASASLQVFLASPCSMSIVTKNEPKTGSYDEDIFTFARLGDTVLLGGGNPVAVRAHGTTVVCGAGLFTIVMVNGTCTRYRDESRTREVGSGAAVACTQDGDTLKIDGEDDVTFTGDLGVSHAIATSETKLLRAASWAAAKKTVDQARAAAAAPKQP